MVVRSIFLPLCLYFCSVFEGEAYIVLAVDRHEIQSLTPGGGHIDHLNGVHIVARCVRPQ